MLRIRINVFLAMVLASGLWACAPRGTPAPVIIGGAGAPVPEYPAATHGKGSVVVQPGDTLYAISRYHQTALQALVEANNLAPPFIIKPGQVLRLPGQLGQPGAPPPPAASAQNQIASTELAPPVSTPAKKREDEVKQTAGAEKISPPNAIVMNKTVPTIARPADPTPDSGEDQSSTHSMEDGAVPALPPPAPVRKPIEVEKKTAALPAAAAVATPVRESRVVRFLWPAKGPILSDFGPKQNGLHNDGINIAMPPNGPIMAAGDGIVSYAGNGLRGYGNLLLIRHEGGWVTAYAHNSELLVEKGVTVKRGQLIAKAGRSGGVNQDQLHFEIRQGTKAVDPKPLLVGG